MYIPRTKRFRIENTHNRELKISRQCILYFLIWLLLLARVIHAQNYLILRPEGLRENSCIYYNISVVCFHSIYVPHYCCFWGPFLLDDDDMVGSRARSAKNRTSTLSRPASSGEARQLQLSHPEILNGDESSWKSFPRSKSSDASVNAGSRLDCLLNPLLTDTQISRSHFETTKEQLPRRRSLPTEEDTRTTGCFNLRSSAVKKCRVNPIDGSKGNLEKPNWLNICDPCNKVLERSITPDISDVLLQKIDKSLRHLDTVAPSLAFGAESFTTVVTGHGNNRSIESERRTQNFVAPKGNLDIRVTCKNGGGTINSPLEYGRQGEHILKNNRPVGRSPKIIAENKVFRRSRRSDDADAVVANNNLCEKREIVACAESGRHLSRNVAVTDHRRLIRKIETATQFSEQSQRSNSDTGTFEVLSDRSAAEVKPSGGERRCPSFEEDYEKCIESINRQLSLEFGNADSKCKTKKLIESDQQPEVLQKLEVIELYF